MVRQCGRSLTQYIAHVSMHVAQDKPDKEGFVSLFSCERRQRAKYLTRKSDGVQVSYNADTLLFLAIKLA